MHFILEKGQTGILVNEYCPGHIKEAKRADIFLLLLDEDRKKYASWLFDIKMSVGGKDVIKYLIKQW